MKNLLFILFFLINMLSTQASSQSPFSELELTIQLDNNINKNNFHEYWKMNKGFNFNYTTPFYLGKIQGGLNYMQFSSKYKFRPDFQSYFIYAGWLYDFQLINKLSFAPCIKIGNYLMNFDIESQYEKYESEVCIEYSILLKYSLNESVAINLELGKNFVYTYKNIDLILLKTGISFQLETPEFFNGIQE